MKNVAEYVRNGGGTASGMDGTHMRDRLSWIGLGVVAVGIAVLVLTDVFTDMSGFGGVDIASLVWVTALLVVIGGSALGAYRGRGGKALQHAAIWLGIIAVLALIYTYRDALGIDLG